MEDLTKFMKRPSGLTFDKTTDVTTHIANNGMTYKVLTYKDSEGTKIPVVQLISKAVVTKGLEIKTTRDGESTYGAIRVKPENRAIKIEGDDMFSIVSDKLIDKIIENNGSEGAPFEVFAEGKTVQIASFYTELSPGNYVITAQAGTLANNATFSADVLSGLKEVVKSFTNADKKVGETT